MALTQIQKTAKDSLQKSLQVMGAEIKSALPKHMEAERFNRIVMTAVSRTPKLLDCDQHSFFGSLLLAAQLGLEPNGPDQKAFLIPYGKECQFQLGYRGMLDLARRSGELISIHAEIAYENDPILQVLLGMNPSIEHEPLLTGDRGKPVLAYSVAKLRDGSIDFTWMSYEDIERARESNRGKSPAWEKWWSEMAKKVVMKRHLKTLPLNAEIQRAIGSDETFKQTIATDMTEVQEGEDLESVEEKEAEELDASMATAEDKGLFYEWLTEKGLNTFLTVAEKTQITQGISKQELKAMAPILRDRKASAEAPAEAKVKSPASDEVEDL